MKKNAKIFRYEELVDEFYDCTLLYGNLTAYADAIGGNALIEECEELRTNLYWIKGFDNWFCVSENQFDCFLSNTPMLV